MRPLLERLDRALTPRRTILVSVLCGVLSAAGWLWLVAVGRASVAPDFEARWTAGRLLVTGRGALLYDGPEQWAVQGLTGPGQPWSWFVSPPHTAVLFAPLGALPWPVATAAWVLLATAALLTTWALTTRWWLPDLSGRARLALLLVWVTALTTLELVASGQDSAFIALAGVVAARLWQRGWGLSAGLVMSAGLLKPQLVFLVPFLALAVRAWRALAGLSLGGAIVLVLGFVPDHRSWLAWWETVTSEGYHHSITAGQSHLSVTTSSLVLAVVPPSWHGPLGSLGLVAAALGAAGMTWWWHRHHIPGPVLALTLVTATMVCAPHLMRYDAVVALPVLSVALSRWGTPATRGLAAVSYLVAAASQLQWVVPPSASWPLVSLRAPALAILALIWFVVALRLGRAQTARAQPPDVGGWALTKGDADVR